MHLIDFRNVGAIYLDESILIDDKSTYNDVMALSNTWTVSWQPRENVKMWWIQIEKVQLRSSSQQRPLLYILNNTILSYIIGITPWASNYIHMKLWEVITHTDPNFNDSLDKPPLNLVHWWVITSHI